MGEGGLGSGGVLATKCWVMLLCRSYILLSKKPESSAVSEASSALYFWRCFQWHFCPPGAFFVCLRTQLSAMLLMNVTHIQVLSQEMHVPYYAHSQNACSLTKSIPANCWWPHVKLTKWPYGGFLSGSAAPLGCFLLDFYSFVSKCWSFLQWLMTLIKARLQTVMAVTAHAFPDKSWWNKVLRSLADPSCTSPLSHFDSWDLFPVPVCVFQLWIFMTFMLMTHFTNYHSTQNSH